MSIKSNTMAALLALTVSSAYAVDDSKEIYIGKIIAYQRSSLAGPNSAFLKTWLEPLKRNNPNLPDETWRTFLSDVSALVESEVLKAGEPGEVMLRTRLGAFTENELRSLSEFLPSPTYQRFQEALAHPVIVDAAMERLIRRVQEVGSQISAAASSRDLKVR